MIDPTEVQVILANDHRRVSDEAIQECFRLRAWLVALGFLATLDDMPVVATWCQKALEGDWPRGSGAE